MNINKTVTNLKKRLGQNEQTYFGRGKLLLSGEYFVLDGASALVLPTKLGQSMTVRYSPSFNPKLHWKSFDSNNDLWFESKFEFWHFDCLDSSSDSTVMFLQKILRQARKQNQHFLRDDVDVYVETNLEFPLDWGLGSSSTLIYNIAQWAYVSPFNLLFNIYNGSGYDVAAASSDCPIIYEKGKQGPNWRLSKFDPVFKDNLYFVFMGNKADSFKAIEAYLNKKMNNTAVVNELSKISCLLEEATTLRQFNSLIKSHEQIVSETLNMTTMKDACFSDFWGEVKSLGAWGGDFVLVTSNKSSEETKEYFSLRGNQVVIPYEEMVYNKNSKTNFYPLPVAEDTNKISHFLQ